MSEQRMERTQMSDSQDIKITTGTTSHTDYFEDGERVFPCSCGVTHRGDYAAYDFGHHNCFHGEFMHLAENIPDTLICVECGMTTRYSGSLPPFN